MECWFAEYNNLFELQETYLLSLLRKLKNTSIGQERGYSSIKSIADFQSQTPIQHYSDLKPYIFRIIAGETNVLSSKPLTHWIQTSGTTGTPKIFPYNEEFEKSLWAAAPLSKNCFIYRVGIEALKILEGDTIFVHASGNCGMIGTGATKQSLAFITGWVAKQSSPNNTFAPPSSIQAITDWEEKIFQMAVYYVQKNVTCLSSVSTYILMLLQKIESAFNGKLFSALAEINPERAAELEKLYLEDGKLKVSRIWPNLLYLSLGGVNPFLYKNWIENNLPHSIIFQNYTGSEGLYGFQYDINDPAMVLLPKNAFYEFLDVNEYTNWQFQSGNTPTRYTVVDVKPGKEYVFCVSNDLGFTTYIPGDVIKVVSTHPFLFVYSRRLGQEVNIAAEKMSEEHITTAIKEAEINNPCVYREYLCTAITEPFPHYTVAFDFSIPPQNLDKYASEIEQFICQSNVMYAEVRKMNVLQPLRVIHIPPGEFERYIAVKNKVGEWNAGQMKLPHLTVHQDFIKFFQVINEGISRFI